MITNQDDDAVRDGGEPLVRTRLDRWVAGTAKVLAWAIFIAFAVSVYEVVARYVFDRPTYWAHESTTFLIAVIFLVGGPIALARDKHIRVRVVYDTVSPERRRWLDVVNSIITLAFLGGLGYAAAIMAWQSTHTPTGAIQLEGTGTAWNPPTPALIKITILIVVSVMIVQTILHLISAVRGSTPLSKQVEGS